MRVLGLLTRPIAGLKDICRTKEFPFSCLPGCTRPCSGSTDPLERVQQGTSTSGRVLNEGLQRNLVILRGFAADAAAPFQLRTDTEGVPLKQWSTRQLRKPQNSGRKAYERGYKKQKFIAAQAAKRKLGEASNRNERETLRRARWRAAAAARSPLEAAPLE